MLQLAMDSVQTADEETELVSVWALVYTNMINERCDKSTGPLFVWNQYISEVLTHPRRFQRRYRMSFNAFQQLCGLLEPILRVSHPRSTIRVEIVLHCMLRWLAGGSYDDISAIASLSVPTFFRYVNFGMNALLACESLAIRFPSSEAEMKSQCESFEGISMHGVIKGCIGAVDGWLCRVKTPTKRETAHVTSYFSGHYHCFGVNVQASCDHLSRFTSFSIKCPGGTNDVRAFQLSSLYNICSNLPLGVYLVGDNAYIPTETMLTPYSAADGMTLSKDSFNFFVSQLRIKIEQAFGLMVTKWRILKKPLEVGLKNVPLVVHTIMRLHNFCVSSRENGYRHVSEVDKIYIPADRDSRDLGYVPSSIETVGVQPRTCVLREEICKHIWSQGYRRPEYNIRRRAGNQDTVNE